MKPEMFQDEKLAPLTPIDRFVFVGLIAMADDTGRVLDIVKVIDAFIFPLTDDSAKASLDLLVGLGIIERGRTESGQNVIQIARWKDHQKIDKPNYSSALPPIVLRDAGDRARRNIPAELRLAVIEHFGGKCVECSAVVKVNKENKYDSAPNLAEIDHLIAVADGGTNDIQNLRLLCLACNRIKQGREHSERNRRAFDDASSKGPRTVVESSAPHTYDQRPTTNDLSTTAPDDKAVRPSLLEVDNRIVEYTRRVREKTASKNDLMTLRVAVLFSYWAAKFGHGTRVLLDAKRETKLRTRLKENGGNLSELLYAVDGAARDEWLIEKGLTGIETIFRDRGTVEKYSQKIAACVSGEMHGMEKHITRDEPPAASQLQVVN